jgi:DNA-binding transcriptional LysR family regulator
MGSGNKLLDLDWLEDFLTLSDTGNFSRAAEARAIAQPALSRHIKSLEEWTGVDLIDRTAHPVELTAAGKKFRPLVEAILANLEAARIKAKAAQDQASASLRFASTHALSLTFSSGFVCSFCREKLPGENSVRDVEAGQLNSTCVLAREITRALEQDLRVH